MAIDIKTANLSRIALILAGVVAVSATGVGIWRNSQGTAPSPVAAAAPPQTQAQVAEMITSLEAKLKANPNDAEGWRTLGWSFFETGRYGESATAYKRATQLAPDKADYWSSLGEALVLAGAGDVPPDAKAAFTTAVARDPRDPRARYFLAVAKDMGGDHSGAIDDWLALLKDTPAGAPWESDVRKVIEQVGAKEKIEVASRLAAIRPGTAAPSVATAAIPGPTPEQMRAATALPPGQQDAMVKSMVEGLAAKLANDPKNVDGWIMLMRSRVTLGEESKARQALNAAIEANPLRAEQLKAAARELGIAV